MSKQIRIAEESLEKLNKIAKETGKPKSLCTSLIVDLFTEIYEQLDEGGQLFIEKDGEKIRLIPNLMPAKKPAQTATPAQTAAIAGETQLAKG